MTELLVVVIAGSCIVGTGIVVGVVVSKFDFSFKEEISRRKERYHMTDVQVAAAQILVGYLSFRFNWKFAVGILSVNTSPGGLSYDLSIMSNRYSTLFVEVGSISLYEDHFWVHIPAVQDHPPLLGCSFEYSDPDCFKKFARWFLKHCK